MASSPSPSRNPLNKIVFVQKVLLFGCSNPKTPIYWSYVNNAWRETLVSDQFSTAVTAWSHQISAAFINNNENENSENEQTSKEDKQQNPPSSSVSFEKFFEDPSTRFRPWTWPRSYVSLSLILSSAIRNNILWIVGDFHRAGFPKNGPCFASRFSPITNVLDVTDPLNLAVSSSKPEVLELLLFSESCRYYCPKDDDIFLNARCRDYTEMKYSMHPQNQQQQSYNNNMMNRGGNSTSSQNYRTSTSSSQSMLATSVPNKQYLSPLLVNAARKVADWETAQRLKALISFENNILDDQNNDVVGTEQTSSTSLVDDEAVQVWEKSREVFHKKLSPPLQVVVLLVMRVKYATQINEIRAKKILRDTTTDIVIGDDSNHSWTFFIDPFHDIVHDGDHDRLLRNQKDDNKSDEPSQLSMFINSQSSKPDSATALHVSCQSEETLPLTKYLVLMNSAKITNNIYFAFNDTRSPLMVAAGTSSSSCVSSSQQNKTSTFHFLLNHLFHKKSENNLDVFLREHFIACSSHSDGNNFLHRMILDGNVKAIKMFYDFVFFVAASPLQQEQQQQEEKDRNEKNIVPSSSSSSFPSNLLLELVNNCYNSEGDLPIHTAVRSLKNNNESLSFNFLKLLIEKGGADVNKFTMSVTNVPTALHICVEKREPRLCQYLFENGAKIDIPNLETSVWKKVKTMKWKGMEMLFEDDVPAV